MLPTNKYKLMCLKVKKFFLEEDDSKEMIEYVAHHCQEGIRSLSHTGTDCLPVILSPQYKSVISTSCIAFSTLNIGEYKYMK